MSLVSDLDFSAVDQSPFGGSSEGFDYVIPSDLSFDETNSEPGTFLDLLNYTASAELYGGLTGAISGTTGSLQLSYPISVDARFASTVSDGQTVTIDTSDYTVDGASLSLVGPGIGADLSLALGGSLALTVGSTNLIDDNFDESIALSTQKEFDFGPYGSITIKAPPSFSANSGSAVSASGALPQLTASGQSSDFLSGSLELANLVASVFGLPPLSDTVTVAGVDVSYNALTADLEAGLALGEDVTFNPTGVSATMTCDGQTETKPLGQSFTFTAPSSGSGTMDVNASYTLYGTITTQTGIIGNLDLNISALGVSASALGATVGIGPLIPSTTIPATPLSTGLQSWNSKTTEFNENPLTTTADYEIAYGPSNGGTVTPTPKFSIVSSPTVAESAGKLTFTIDETGALSQNLTVYVSTVQNWNGSGVYNTSTPGSHVSTNYYYDGLPSVPITFAATSASSSSQQISIAINPVGLTSGSETFGFEVQELNSSGGLDPDPAASTPFTIVNQPSTTTAPTISSITSSPSSGGVVTAGHSVTFIVTFSAPVTVNMAGGPPLLTLNDNETASYTGGSGTNALTFVYNVNPGDQAGDLQVTGLTIPNGSAIANLAGTAAVTTGATENAGIQINTTAPTVRITTTGGLVGSFAQTISGTVDVADAGTKVTVFDGANAIGTATVASNGAWTANVTLSVSGANTVVAKDTNSAGNTGVSNQIFYTVDTTTYSLAPSNPIAHENQGSLVFTLTRANDTSANTVFVQTNGTQSTNPNSKYFNEENLIPVYFPQNVESATFSITINDNYATSGSQTFRVSIYPSLSASGTPLAATTFTIEDTDTSTGALTGNITENDTRTGTTTISSPVNIYDNATLQNNGVIDINSGGSIGGDNSGGVIYNPTGSVINVNTADSSAHDIDVSRVNNDGTINLSPGSGNIATIWTVNGGISDTGTINVLSGTLRLLALGSSGTASLNASGISVGANASIVFEAGTFAIAGGTYNVAGSTIIGGVSPYFADVVFGAGTVVNVGGDWFIGDSSSLDFSAATLSGTFSSLNLSSGAYRLSFGSHDVTINDFNSYLVTISDSGTITLTGAITSDATWSGGGTVINEGTITAPAYWQPSELTSGETFVNYGTVNNIVVDAGATFNNDAGGTLNLVNFSWVSGEFNNYGLVNLAGSGSGYSQVSGVLNNAGTIHFSAASGWTLNDGGTSNASGLIIDTGLTLFFGGTDAADTYTITGGTFGGGGNLWVLSGAKAKFAASTQVDIGFHNDGTIEVASGALTLEQALTGSGTVTMDAGTTLALAAPQGFANTISGFSSGDTIDLIGVAATDASINASDQLVVTEAGTSVATLHMTGSYPGAGLQFLLASDGRGGTAITLGVPSPPAVSAGAVAAFADSNSPAAVALDGAVTVIGGGSPSLASATVSIAAGFLQGDSLAATTTGTNISASYDTSAGVLRLSGSDSLANYDSVLQSVIFDSVADARADGANPIRTISWMVNDGTRSSLAATSTVTITDAPPTVTVAATPTLAVGGVPTPVTLEPTLTVSDIDNTTLVGATVSIGYGFSAGDILGVSTTGTAITVASNTGGVLKLTGVDTLADYQAVLRSVTLTSSNASGNTRIIVWQVNDGNGVSTLATSSVDIAPTLTIASKGVLTNQTTQTISGTIDAADAGLTVSIYDGTTLLSTVTPAANGNWSKSVTLLSTQGAQAITAQATDAAGLGTSSAVTYTLVGPSVTVAG
ncbi:MAG: hypothetical protein WAU78_09350, partial [Roseiarcus sp.]